MPPRLKKGRISEDEAPVAIGAEMLNPSTIVANHPEGSVQVSRIPSFGPVPDYRVMRMKRRAPNAGSVVFNRTVSGAAAALALFRSQWNELANQISRF